MDLTCFISARHLFGMSWPGSRRRSYSCRQGQLAVFSNILWVVPSTACLVLFKLIEIIATADVNLC